MTIVDLATLLGTSLAVVSMIVSIWQASRAKSAANRAEEMRDKIAQRTANSELGGLNGALGAAIRAMDKYGPGAGTVARRGCSPESDAASVRALTGEMTRLRILLVEKLGNEVNDVISNVNELLIKFAEAASTVERDQSGRDIYIKIVELSGNIKKQLDQNIYL